MSELPPEPASEPPAPATRTLPPDVTGAVEPRSRDRFADRTWPLAAVVAVALVALLIGGLAGALLATVANDGADTRMPGYGRMHQPGDRVPPGHLRRGHDHGHGRHGMTPTPTG